MFCETRSYLQRGSTCGSPESLALSDERLCNAVGVMNQLRAARNEQEDTIQVEQSQFVARL